MGKYAMNERGWQLALTTIGVMIGLITAFIYFGGSLRQIDINSMRLNNIETHGSPAVQSLLMQSADVRADQARTDAVIATLPASDAEQRTLIATLRDEVAELRHDHVAEVQRLASLEALCAVLYLKQQGRL